MSMIKMSALGPSLAEQCAELGLVATGVGVELADRLSDAVTLCYIHGALTDSETDKARKRILVLMRLRQVRPAKGAA